MHPRLSVSEMCTYPLAFGDELALWDELGVRQVGLLTNKVDAFGRDAAIAALRERSMRATTVITSMFDLSDPTSWDATRAAVNDSIDLAAEVGGCTYFTPGRRDGRSFDELATSLAEAVAPCAKYAESRGVTLAIEPSLRTDVSFVHTLRDGTDVAERAGIGVIADVGNCWMERDPEDAVRRAGERLAVFQISDAVFGTFERPVARRSRRARRRRPRARRVHPRRARRRVHGSVRARGRRARDRGRGPRAPRCDARSNARTSCCSRCSRESGDRLPRRRDLGGTRPPGARPTSPVARCCASRPPDCVTATSTTSKVGCTRPTAARIPSIAGHEIVGQDRDHLSGSRRGVGRRRRRPGRGAQPRRHARRLPNLRPRLLGRRGIGSLRRVRRAPRAASRLGGVPSPRRSPGRGADHLRTVELRGDLGAPRRAGRRGGHRGARPHGHGHDRGRARGRGADGDRDRDCAGPVPTRRRAACRRRSRDRRRSRATRSRASPRSPTAAWRTSSSTPPRAIP